MMMIEWIDYNEQPIMCVCAWVQLVGGFQNRAFFHFLQCYSGSNSSIGQEILKKKWKWYISIEWHPSIQPLEEKQTIGLCDYYDAKLNWINQSKRSINRLKLLQGNHHDYSIMIFSLVWKKIFSLQSPPVIMGVYTMF